MNEKIECTLGELDEFASLSSKKKRFGRYHGSMFWSLPGFGQNRWVVGANIDLDSTPSAEMSVNEVAEACLAHLNTPPPRKKYAKKQPKPRYGHLELLQAQFSGSRKKLSVLLVTTRRKNRFFWGKGKSV